MKTYSVEQLQALSDEIMKRKKLASVWVTADGQVFKSKNRAELHGKPHKLKVYSFPQTTEEKETVSDETLEEKQPDVLTSDLQTTEEKETVSDETLEEKQPEVLTSDKSEPAKKKQSVKATKTPAKKK